MGDMQVEVLGEFLRESARTTCAVQESQTWRPLPFTRDHVDINKYQAFVSKNAILDIIAWGAETAK
jgi:hypothetical protein